MSVPRSTFAGLLLAGTAACAAHPAARVATADARAPSPITTELCADYLLAATGPICFRPLSAEEQRHRAVSFRLERENGRVRRLERLNGRGFPEVDDDGCSEYRYRFQGTELAEDTGYQPDGVVCDRTLYTEHVRKAAFVDAWGRPNFSNDRTHTGALNERDARGLIVSMRPLASDGTPSQLQSASELRYERDAAGQIARTCYFDAQGKPIKNDAGVHCWTYQHDEFGNLLEQRAWDEAQHPAATGNRAHRVSWKYDKYGNLLRQSLFDAEGKPVTVQDSWCPVLAYHRDRFGFLVGKDCLDGDGKPSRFDEGNSMWRASPDERGRSREFRYFDAQGNPFEPSVGYARIELDHDDRGHVTERRYFRIDNRPGQDDGPALVRYRFSPQHLLVERANFDGRGRPRSNRGCASTTFEHDNYRQVIRQTCRDAMGQPALSNDNVSITISRYDAQGLLAETSYQDASGQAIDGRSGFARELLSHDARGVDSHARHFKANGAELQLRRFSVLSVKPPRAGRFWPAPSRELSLSSIERAERELRAGVRWTAILQAVGNDRVHAANPGDIGYLDFDTLYPAARAVLEPLAVGQYSQIVELPYGLAIYLRTE
ncbi:MAG: hypothetical protein ABUL60_31305 [Myxococcales bacterium]